MAYIVMRILIKYKQYNNNLAKEQTEQTKKNLNQTMIAKILLASIGIMLFTSTNADYNVEQYCQLVPIGTKLPSLADCQTFYICRGHNQVLEAVCPNNLVFDKDAQTCVPAFSSNCNRNLGNPCQNKNNVWVPDTGKCSFWHYCQKGEIMGSGHCANGQILDYNLQKCVNGHCKHIGVGNVCEIMQNDKFFGDLNDCRAWHKCTGSTHKQGNCPTGLIYEAQTRTCVYSNDNTCAGPTEICNEFSANKKIPDSMKCSNYFVCLKQNKKWLWKKFQCPVKQYFNPATNSCVNRQAATPVKTCDRCEYSAAQWVNAVDPDCKAYLVCSNGVKTYSNACVSGIFDEPNQKCIHSTNLINYRQANGACAIKDN